MSLNECLNIGYWFIALGFLGVACYELKKWFNRKVDVLQEQFIHDLSLDCNQTAEQQEKIQSELSIRKKWLKTFTIINLLNWLDKLLLIFFSLSSNAVAFILSEFFLTLIFMAVSGFVFWRIWIKQGTWLLMLNAIMGCLFSPIALIALSLKFMFSMINNGILGLYNAEDFALFTSGVFMYYSIHYGICCWELRKINYAARKQKKVLKLATVT
ncbi:MULTISPECIES: hypothetical protein [Parachlamydia]|jgi:hypothetical protein|uniref:Transmembrane protein n=2 Tax=Parachlamydia acanthamoebae TaxID=83552 RepID=F8KXA9_PARAV|nr:hypothetical protein [Parachlamydia acanthamoebae]EFB41379.1 hypothetical protein pah_c045o092 [Parachlamydia acanthamoebae str. Hall's coccus]KIA78665.1 hypothetical protein DB43_DP00220 [Parachlamydia acanthamoebae]CCB85581.1 putative uncharacterized protein [Parachlamydia acanthamoebae UV-7]